VRILEDFTAGKSRESQIHKSNEKCIGLVTILHVQGLGASCQACEKLNFILGHGDLHITLITPELIQCNPFTSPV